MKSRISKMHRQRTLRRQPTRKLSNETLETRLLLAADLDFAFQSSLGEAASMTCQPESVAAIIAQQGEGEGGEGEEDRDLQALLRASYTAWLPFGQTREDFLNQASGGGEGLPDDPAEAEGNRQVISEIEPNNGLISAQLLDIGTSIGQMRGIDVLGSANGLDVDYFRVRLRKGDIVGVNLNPDVTSITPAAAGTVSLTTSNNSGLVSSQIDANGLGTINAQFSPLPRGGNASYGYVIGEAGDYFVGVNNSIGDYRLNVDIFRPYLEEQPVGTKQIVFLDFDGATIDTTIFGGTSFSSRLTGLDGFLINWGLTTSNRDAVINAVVAEVEAIFNDIRQRGPNGDYRASGIPGEFDVEIRNSRDHADPFGEPYVSRVIIGGTIDELTIETIGIAQSIDVGNFDTKESGVVLLDLLSGPADDPNSINGIPRAPGVPISAAIGRVVGAIAVHEMGHYMGVWHTDPNPAGAGGPGIRNLMDSAGGTGTIGQTAGGVGADGVFGTNDDNPLRFRTDVYNPLEGVHVGVEDVEAAISVGNSTGGAIVPVPGSINGVKFHDLNRNGVRNQGEPGLANFRIFSDLNSNGLLDVDTEPFAVTRADGSFTLIVDAGTHRIVEEQQVGWEQTFPTAPFHIVTVQDADIVNNINFGNAQVIAGVRGVVYQDLNSNGSRQANEPGVEGIFVYADVNQNNRADIGEPATKTGKTGAYKLDLPIFGNYIIRQAPPPGWTQTQPANNAGVSVNIVTGQVVTDVNFGNSGQLFDFGDAIGGYPTTMANNGGRAGVLLGFGLGATVDGEADSRLGNDINDGVRLPQGLFAGVGGQTLEVDISLGGQTLGYLQGWIDFNGDGVWDVGEQIIRDLRLPQGTHAVNFNVPATAVAGATQARFRYGWERGIGPSGAALAGEIEDYGVVVFGENPIANDDFFEGDNAVQQGAVNVFLDVLANDLPSSNPPIIVQSATSPTAFGGTVVVSANPSGVIYTPDPAFFGTDSFTYTIVDAAGKTDSATVTVRVRPEISRPVAFDDSAITGINQSVAIQVLENDLEGPFDPISINRISRSPLSGVAIIDTQGTDDFVIYTPSPGFQGTDQFEYEIIDQIGQVSRANVTINVGDAFSNDWVEYTIGFTNAIGQPISSVVQGDLFFAELYVADIRNRADVPPLPPGDDLRGVFAAYLDVFYPSQQVAVIGDPIFDGPYTSVPEFDISIPGMVDEIGAFQSFAGGVVPQPLGPGPKLLARLPMRAVAPGDGVAEFTLDPADALGNGMVFGPHDTLILQPESAVPLARLRFTPNEINITGAQGEGEDSGFHNRFHPTDVTADFKTDVKDVLAIVSYLYHNGSQTLTPGGAGIGVYPDVNNDFVVSPFDALKVISYLRKGGDVGNGEGEAEELAMLAAATDLHVETPTPAMAPTPAPAPVVGVDRNGESRINPYDISPFIPATDGQRAIDEIFAAADDARRAQFVATQRNVRRLDPTGALEDEFLADILEGWKV